jgi:hypothetical protein
MPTIARIGAYRFFFYSNERAEPPHVHVQREKALAKFWLRTVALASATGFRGHALRQIELLVRENQDSWLEVWNEFFRLGGEAAGDGSDGHRE